MHGKTGLDGQQAMLQLPQHFVMPAVTHIPIHANALACRHMAEVFVLRLAQQQPCTGNAQRSGQALQGVERR
jgi:hypothetical protein